MEQIAEDNPYLPFPDAEISAIEAINYRQGSYGLDTRPKVFDKLSNNWTLLDSGSCLTCTPKEPQDKLDPKLKLRAVNGTSIATYGTRKVNLKMGRKMYSIDAIIADVPQLIFGWDLFKKYSLGFEWNEWGDLLLTDKKSKIQSVLKHVTVPHLSVPRVASMYSQSEQSYFETQCMKQVDALSIQEEDESPFFVDNLPLPSEQESEYDKINHEELQKLEPKYADIVRKYDILKTRFDANPKHNITHVIDTGNASPIKSKVRPLLANSAKSIEGKKIWTEMESMGVIERVHPSTLTQWSSPLHWQKSRILISGGRA